MKFAKLMNGAEEMLPDLKHLYKQLKKSLKRYSAAEIEEDLSEKHEDNSRQALRKDIDKQFFDMLHEEAVQDVERLNEYFCNKEEQCVIWLQQLDEQLESAETTRDRQLCHIGYINLHGQLVLLFHWSMLNYAALVKILKKHDKLLNVQVKAPVLANALKQPFSTTGMLSTLLAACEVKARSISDTTGGLDSLVSDCPEYQDLFLVKETQAALNLWSELRGNATTPSTLLDPRMGSIAALVGRKRTHEGESRMEQRVTHSDAAAEAASLAEGPIAAARRTDARVPGNGAAQRVEDGEGGGDWPVMRGRSFETGPPSLGSAASQGTTGSPHAVAEGVRLQRGRVASMLPPAYVPSSLSLPAKPRVESKAV